MWPYIGAYIKKQIKAEVEPDINNSLPSILTPFRFDLTDFGSMVNI